jgi:hypothetical protein
MMNIFTAFEKKNQFQIMLSLVSEQANLKLTVRTKWDELTAQPTA